MARSPSTVALLDELDGDASALAAEEEREDLVDFRQHADPQSRHDPAVQFIVYESQHAGRGIPMENEDPRTYVRQRG